jgi:hypothetical protein
MPESEEIGAAVDAAIWEAAHEEAYELEARVATLRRVLAALEGEWEEDDDE